MQTQLNTNVERIIAKIDNDFGLDNTDWIPRIGAYVTDALSILKCTPTEYKTIELEVKDRIAILPCMLINTDIKIYDINGCEIEQYKNNCTCVGDKSNYSMVGNPQIDRTLLHNYNPDVEETNTISQNIAMEDDTHKLIFITHELKKNKGIKKKFVILDNRRIELNYNTDFIKVQYKTIKTTYSEHYGCELPMVPNNGLLIEGIVYYCMYKLLCRGQKHPVFNLSASQYGTNPYFMWTTLQEKIKRSVMFDKQGNILEEDGDLWNDALLIFSMN